MNRKWDLFVHTLLVMLVILSLLLTVGIFGSSFQLPIQFQRFFNHEVEDSLSPPTGDLNTAQSHETSLYSVFSPNEIVIADNKDNYLKSKNQDDITQTTEVLFGVTSKLDARHIKEQRLEDFRNNLTGSAYLEFEFADSIPLQFLLSDKEDADSKVAFDRLVIKGDDLSAIYFLNQADQKVYALAIKEADKDKLKQLLNYPKAHTEHFLAAEVVDLGYVRKYLSVDRLDVEARTYMVERQAVPTYLRQLFDSPENIYDYSDSDFQRYYSEDKNLSINNKTQELAFSIDQPKTKNTGRLESLKASFNVLKQYQANLDSWKFISYNNSNHEIGYRKFINGLPVFGPYNVSKVMIRVSEDKIYRLNLSMLSIQTPVTPLSYTVTVMTGREVVDVLSKERIDLKEIQDIHLGYRWVKNTDSDSLIDLIPAWHVKRNGQWALLDQIVDLSHYKDLQTKRTDKKAVVDLRKMTQNTTDNDTKIVAPALNNAKRAQFNQP